MTEQGKAWALHNELDLFNTSDTNHINGEQLNLKTFEIARTVIHMLNKNTLKVKYYKANQK